MSRCSFTYTVRKANNKNVLCLEDRGTGMSLTNGMEDVIEELQASFKRSSKPFPSLVIYKDTEGCDLLSNCIFIKFYHIYLYN